MQNVFEMNKLLAEQASATMKSLFDINLATAKSVVELNQKWVSQAMQAGADQLGTVAGKKDPKEVLIAQAEITKSYVEQSAANANEMGNLMVANGEKVQTWVKQTSEQMKASFEDASEQAKAAFEQVTPAPTARKKKAA